LRVFLYNGRISGVLGKKYMQLESYVNALVGRKTWGISIGNQLKPLGYKLDSRELEVGGDL
jgi:hypothetical protein